MVASYPLPTNAVAGQAGFVDAVNQIAQNINDLWDRVGRDTGWREIAPLSSFTGPVRLRRVGPRVTLRLINASAAGKTADDLINLVDGFRCGTIMTADLVGQPDTLTIHPYGNAVYCTAIGTGLYGETSWITDNAWPSTLPGSAV